MEIFKQYQEQKNHAQLKMRDRVDSIKLELQTELMNLRGKERERILNTINQLPHYHKLIKEGLMHPEVLDEIIYSIRLYYYLTIKR